MSIHDGWEAASPSILIEGGHIRVDATRLRQRNADTVALLSSRLVREAHLHKVGEKLARSHDDRYVIGYLAGLVDGLCQVGGIRNEEQRLGMVERIYYTIFDDKDWTEPLDTLFQEQERDKNIMRGMQEGGDIYFAFDEGEIKSLAAPLILYLRQA